VDIGCGDGNFVRLAQQLGYQAEGLEFDAQAVQTARTKGMMIHQGGLPDTGLPTAAYDVVTLSQVIEHVHAPLAALRECARVLRPGGMLWVATPNMDAPGHQRFGANWRGLEPPRHLTLFTAEALTQALGQAGFADITLKPIGPVSRWFINASRLIEQGIKPPASAQLSVRDRLASSWLDLRANRSPRRGEELVATAVLPRR
jgi:SAM-dependent methyltransferase